MRLSFYSLFSAYAKHTQRYFSTIAEDPHDYSEIVESFHSVLLSALYDFGDNIREKGTCAHDLSGRQISALVPMLSEAYKEALEDAELEYDIRSCYFPLYFESLVPGLIDSRRKQFAGYLRKCCPLNQDSADSQPENS
jgi:hypothetical protein